VTRLALGIGGVALLVAALFGFGDPARFLRAYLVGYTFWLCLALGSLGLAFVQFLTGGLWGLTTRRIFEAGASTLPLLAVLFVPVLIGVPVLYPWTSSTDPLVVHKSVYLNVPFFGVRAVAYFAVWLLLAELLRRRSRDADPVRLQRLSVIGLLVLSLTASFAAIDWWMSLEPEWFSTLYPPLWCMVALLLAMAFAIVVLTVLGGRHPLRDVIGPRVLNDVGSLLLAFLMLWAYMTYFQYMLIWSGNLHDEITWYLRRVEGGWLAIAWFLVVGGFLGPFWLLLFRGLKRSRRWLGAISVWLLVVQAVDVVWLLAPSFAPAGGGPDWLQLVAWVGVGGLWLAVFRWRLMRVPLLAVEDPRLESARDQAYAAA
jgi:hypothetical protein